MENTGTVCRFREKAFIRDREAIKISLAPGFSAPRIGRMNEGKGGSKDREKERDAREQRCMDIRSLLGRREDPVDARHVFIGFPSI